MVGVLDILGDVIDIVIIQIFYVISLLSSCEFIKLKFFLLLYVSRIVKQWFNFLYVRGPAMILWKAIFLRMYVLDIIFNSIYFT